MTDDQLSDVWTTLDPSARQLRRIDARLFDWIEARDTPIAAEWLGLFRGAPFATLGLATVSALAVAATPLVWFAGAFLN